ncbi:MAG: glycosyl transferase [Anaerolineales bacterium]|nr:glycosyl transferase [Anaerolineales bacterium]
MRYGHFDDQKQEYVLDRPDPPLPWINYLGSDEFFGLISNTGGGYSFYKDARLRRLTRYRYNNVPPDSNGRFLYLRDDDAQDRLAGPRFWTPSWQPMRMPLDTYECRHGMGYTSIRSSAAGIECCTRYFVPLGETLEVWELTLTNHRPQRAQLSAIAAVEFNLWDAHDDATNYQRNYSVGEVEVADGVIYHKTEYRERRNHFAYLACSEPVIGFDTQREAFLGAYRGWDSPAAVEAGELSGSIAHGWQPIGALHLKAELEPGQQKKVIFLLGYHENPVGEKFEDPESQVADKRRVLPTIGKYLKPEVVESAFQALRLYWTSSLNTLQVVTPDPHTNRMVNIWNAYQVMITFNLSRSASYFESGIGRGMGFRDSNQDLLGFVQFSPARARERILDLAATQLPSGGAYHQYQPLTKRGNNDIGSGFNDDPLWLVLSVSAYLKETDDWGILQVPVVYDNQPATEERLLEHLRRSIQYTLDRLGPHGLPLIGRADWNDCLNLNCFSDVPGQPFQTTTNRDGHVAESVFIAGLFVLAAKEMGEIATRLGEAGLAELCSTATQKMEAAIGFAGWDGEWFRRAYDDSGRPLGSKENDEGRIFIEPQGICVMAGLGLDDGRARQALDSVADQLATPHGIVLQQPAFHKYYLHLGEISSYPPGYKENAGVFCHTNPWIMIAEAMVGRGDRAHDYYLRINPSAREQISDIHRCEPYVYAQMIAGRDAPTFGEAKNSWLTGTAAWNYVAITQWILGIRPTYEGLRITPVIPSSWDGFEAERSFRGARYAIQVKRKGPGNAVQLEVDGRPLNGTVIPLPPQGVSSVQVVAWLGQE